LCWDVKAVSFPARCGVFPLAATAAEEVVAQALGKVHTGVFSKDLPWLMYGFGDADKPLKASVCPQRLLNSACRCCPELAAGYWHIHTEGGTDRCMRG